jgi:hypothetical protein
MSGEGANLVVLQPLHELIGGVKGMKRVTTQHLHVAVPLVS